MPVRVETTEERWRRVSADYARTVVNFGTGSRQARRAWEEAVRTLNELTHVDRKHTGAHAASGDELRARA